MTNSKIEIGPLRRGQITPTSARDLDGTQTESQFSQELQLLSPDSNSSLNWVVGAYYFDGNGETRPQTINLSGPAVAPAGPVANVVSLVTDSEQTTKSISGFGQVTWRPSGALSLTAGLRYTSEKREISGFTQAFRNNGTNFFLVPQVNDSQTFNKLTWRLAAAYEITPDAMAYVSYNRGFKSGGFNPAAPTIPPYKPEVLDSYEVGLKLTGFDRRVRFNTSAFYYDYRDVQVRRLVFGGLAIYNGSSAELYGLDMELSAQITPNFQVNAGYSYTHARYKAFPNAVVATKNAGPGYTINFAGDATGNTMPFAPKSTFNADVTYTVPLGGGELALTGNVYYNSGYFAEPDNVLKQAGYTLLGASAEYRFPGDQFSIRVWGTNLTDRKTSDYLATQPTGNTPPGVLTWPGFARYSPGAPRQIGVTGTLTF